MCLRFRKSDKYIKKSALLQLLLTARGKDVPVNIYFDYINRQENTIDMAPINVDDDEEDIIHQVGSLNDTILTLYATFTYAGVV